jgi:glycosyltransferase involved in cell wall biosynthesis
MNLAIAEELQKLDIGVSTYGGVNATLPASPLNFTEVFRFDVFQEVGTSDPATYVQENFYYLNQIFLEDLQKIDNYLIEKNDLVFFQGVVQNQIEGISEWLSGIPSLRRPPCILTLRFLNSRMLHNVQRGFTAQIEIFYKYTLQKLLQKFPETKLVADTHELCENFKNITSLPVTLLPSPLGLSQPTNLFTPKTSDENFLDVLYIGNHSPYKGVAFIPEIMKDVLDKHANVRFSIQINGSIESGLAQRITSLVSLYGRRINLILGTLDMDEYHRTIEKADVVLLPYHPAYYSFGGSGVFVEAAASAKIIVITKATVADKIAADYALPVVFSDGFNTEAYCRAVNSAIENIEQLSKQAKLVANYFREYNSPKNFLRELFLL